MSPDAFIEGIRDLLHERAKAGEFPPASDLANLLRQVETVFERAALPGEESSADLRETVESLQNDLDEAEKRGDRLEGQVDRLQARVDAYGDDPDTGRAEEVERLRDLMRDSAELFAELASELAAPRARKERIVGVMRSQVAQMRAEVGGKGDDE